MNPTTAPFKNRTWIDNSLLWLVFLGKDQPFLFSGSFLKQIQEQTLAFSHGEYL